MQNKKLSAVIIFLILSAGLIYFFGISSGGAKASLQIYVPCGMTLPFQELIKAYESRRQNIRIEPAFDNTNVLVKLILDKGKRPDIFISPGEKEIGFLEEKGMVVPGDRRPFGEYRLVLICPAKSGNVNNLSDLGKESVKTIAIANPNFTSVGDYAVQALKSLGYWDKIKDKVLFTNAPIETLSFVASAKADAGIHYNSCPFETNSGKISQGSIKIVEVLPRESHPVIHNYAVILKEAKHERIARNFLSFMFSRGGQNILGGYGLIPGGSSESKAVYSAGREKENRIVNLVAYYPFNEEHLDIKKYLMSLMAKHKGKLKVECVDFRADEGYNRWRKSGLSCGGLLINGRNKFKIPPGEKEIEFIKRPGIYWSKEDLEAVISSELSQGH